MIFFPVFLPAPLENVPERVQQYVVAGVAAVSPSPRNRAAHCCSSWRWCRRLRAYPPSRPEGRRTHCSVWLSGPAPAANGNLGNIADSKGKMMGRGNIQRILCVHTSFTSILRVHRTLFLEIPRWAESRVFRTCSASGGQYHNKQSGKSPFPCCRDHSIIPENKNVKFDCLSCRPLFLRRFDRPPCGIIEDNLANHKAAPPQAGPVFSNSHKGSAFMSIDAKTLGRSETLRPAL